MSCSPSCTDCSVSCGLFMNILGRAKEVPLPSCFGSVFHHEGTVGPVTCSVCTTRDERKGFPLRSRVCCVTLANFCVLATLCIPGMNTTSLACTTLLMCCWSQFASVLLRVYMCIFMRDSLCNHLCLCFPVWLWYPCHVGSTE